MSDRRAFLSHVVISSAVACGFAFAWQKGVPQTVFSSDKSMMTSAIAGLLLVTMIVLGRQAWREDGGAHFGYLAEKLSVMMGLAGTTIGLSMQAAALSSGAASFGALATSLYTTASGVAAAALISIMAYSIERAHR